MKPPVITLIVTALISLAASQRAGAQILTGSLVNNPTGTVNLTSQGSADWLKYDYAGGAPSITRKLGGTGLNFAYGSGVGGYSLINPGASAPAFSWTDGNPTLQASGVQTGLRLESSFGSFNNGFKLTVPSGNLINQTLTVYFGGQGADGYLVNASLSDAGSTPYTSTFGGGYSEVYKALTLDFSSASPGQTLTLNFNPTSNAAFAYNNIEFYGATLATAAVPEPSTWITSALLLGVMLQRIHAKRKAAAAL